MSKDGRSAARAVPIQRSVPLEDVEQVAVALPRIGCEDGASLLHFPDEAAKRIGDAGAAGVLVTPSVDGGSAYYSKLAAVPSIPTAKLS